MVIAALMKSVVARLLTDLSSRSSKSWATQSQQYLSSLLFCWIRAATFFLSFADKIGSSSSKSSVTLSSVEEWDEVVGIISLTWVRPSCDLCSAMLIIFHLLFLVLPRWTMSPYFLLLVMASSGLAKTTTSSPDCNRLNSARPLSWLYCSWCL